MAPRSPEKVFNDFVAAAGGGIDLHVSGRVWVRPDARLMMVVDGWRSHWLGVAGVHLAFEFAGRTPSPRGHLR
jgi:hypothetical protein